MTRARVKATASGAKGEKSCSLAAVVVGVKAVICHLCLYLLCTG